MVEVVVPFAGSCPHRARALKWTSSRYYWPVTIAPGSTPWVKAEAVTPALERSSAEIIIVADADCWTEGLPAAVEAVVNGAPWAIPHWLVKRLTERDTDILIGGGEPAGPYDRREYVGVAGGGFVVAPRETLLEIPLDSRFIGWGQEDDSWALALTALAGEPWRGKADLIHLYHPPAARTSRRKGSPASWSLFHRYIACRRDPDAMRELLKEVRRGHDQSPRTAR